MYAPMIIVAAATNWMAAAICMDIVRLPVTSHHHMLIYNTSAVMLQCDMGVVFKLRLPVLNSQGLNAGHGSSESVSSF